MLAAYFGEVNANSASVIGRSTVGLSRPRGGSAGVDAADDDDDEIFCFFVDGSGLEDDAFVCVCVRASVSMCVRVCKREREREREPNP